MFVSDGWLEEVRKVLTCVFLFNRAMKATTWSVSATICRTLQLKERVMTELVIALLSSLSASSVW